MDTDTLRKRILELTGEDVIDLFGEDGCGECAEKYLEEIEEEIFANKFGTA